MKDEFQAVKEETLAEMRKADKPNFATVEEITAEGLKIKTANSPTASQKSYKRLGSYISPSVGDRVLVKWIGNPRNSNDGTYLIIGKVI